MIVIVKAVGPVILTFAASMSLTGCYGSEYLTLRADETDLPVCAPEYPVPVRVESLEAEERSSCDLRGGTLLFPDGTLVEMSEFGGTGSYEFGGFSYGYFNVGIYGIVATQHGPQCSEVVEWGRREAVDKLHEAFGEEPGSWSCDS